MISEHLEIVQKKWATFMTIFYGSFLELDCYWSSPTYTVYKSSMNILLTTCLMTWLEIIQVFNNTRCMNDDYPLNPYKVNTWQLIKENGNNELCGEQRSTSRWIKISKIYWSFKIKLSATEIVFSCMKTKCKSTKKSANKYKPFPSSSHRCSSRVTTAKFTRTMNMFH